VHGAGDLHRVRITNLGGIGLLLIAACRGAAPGADQARSDSALTARTWGLAYLQQNQLPRAEAEFTKVVALAPDQALGYANLGLVYLREGRYREAEAQLKAGKNCFKDMIGTGPFAFKGDWQVNDHLTVVKNPKPLSRNAGSER